VKANGNTSGFLYFMESLIELREDHPHFRKTYYEIAERHAEEFFLWQGELIAKEMEVTEKWGRAHNYTGIYKWWDWRGEIKS
jgi:hypothetical protein